MNEIITMLRINYLYTIEDRKDGRGAEDIADCFRKICEMVREPQDHTHLSEIGSFLLKEMFRVKIYDKYCKGVRTLVFRLAPIPEKNKIFKMVLIHQY